MERYFPFPVYPNNLFYRMGEDFVEWPTKTILILITGVTTLIIKFMFDLNFKNLKSSIVQKLTTHN
jgi:hypothetical protein